VPSLGGRRRERAREVWGHNEKNPLPVGTGPHADSRYITFLQLPVLDRATITGLGTQTMTVAAGSVDYRAWEALHSSRSFTFTSQSQAGVKITPDFGGVTSMTEVAQRIGDKLTNVTVTYTAATRLFTFTSNGAGIITVVADPADGSLSLLGEGMRLLETDDGGIYMLNNPAGTAAGDRYWQSLNGKLTVGEFNNIEYDWLNNVLTGGAQDAA